MCERAAAAPQPDGINLYLEGSDTPLDRYGVIVRDGWSATIEVRDVILICGGETHEHDMRCYQAADDGPPLLPDAVADQKWMEGDDDA